MNFRVSVKNLQEGIEIKTATHQENLVQYHLQWTPELYDVIPNQVYRG
jgi:chorismate mutase